MGAGRGEEEKQPETAKPARGEEKGTFGQAAVNPTSALKTQRGRFHYLFPGQLPPSPLQDARGLGSSGPRR